MAHIEVTKGLDIPIKGQPTGPANPLVPSGAAAKEHPKLIALDLRPFETVKFRLLAKVDEFVKVGQPLAEDKDTPGRMFCSPAAGVIKEIRRGLKRALLAIVIEVQHSEEYYEHPTVNIEQATPQQLIEAILHGGAFTFIYSRPFNLLANPAKAPRSIFVKAIESAPFVPPAEMQVEGYENDFQAGLDALAKLTQGKIHLVYRKGTHCRAFTEAKQVQHHTAEGPHPIGNHSLHIQQIDPIQSANDCIWTLNAHDVVSIGHLLTKGKVLVERVISIAGPGILPDRTGYFKTRAGIPVSLLISGRIGSSEPLRLISGDPLMGKQIKADDFLGYSDYVFCVVPEGTEREFLHFFRLGTDKYTFSKAYLTGHLDNSERRYSFTTSQHGEHRPFIDASLYDKVMPLPVPTMLLVKAVMAEDYELAAQLGLLEVASEDFALPTFVCPSKMEMVDIIKGGLRQYAHDLGM